MPSVAAASELASYTSDIRVFKRSSPRRGVSFAGNSGSISSSSSKGDFSSISQSDSPLKDEILCRLRHSISIGADNWMRSSDFFSLDDSMASASASSPMPGFYARRQTLVKPSMQFGTALEESGQEDSCFCGLRCGSSRLTQNTVSLAQSATDLAARSQSEEDDEGRYLRCGGTVARTDSGSIVVVDLGTF